MGSGEKVPSGGVTPRPVSIIAAGDDFVSQRLSLSEEPGLLRLREVLRGADVACANLEVPIGEPSAYPMNQYSWAPYPTNPPWKAEELRWLGFDMMCLANNHFSDWSFEAILTNQRVLREAGIECAGAGMSLREARQPAYVDTPHGRVGLIAVDSSWVRGELTQVAMASDPRGSVRGRAGVNGLPWYRSVEVDRESMKALKRILDKLDDRWLQKPDVPRTMAGELQFLGSWFREGSEFKVHTWCDERHLKDILRWVECAKSDADYVVVSQHVHWAEYGNPAPPPDYVREFAHAAIDAGADMYFASSHWIQGIEIYKQRPIFYRIGTMGDTVRGHEYRHPSDTYEHWCLDAGATPADLERAIKSVTSIVALDSDFRIGQVNESVSPIAGDVDGAYPPAEGFLAHVTFEGSKLTGARVIPLDMKYGEMHHESGIPVLAEGEVARRTLEYVAEASKEFGTKIDVATGEIDCGA